MEGLLEALGLAPGDENESVLFRLAEADPRLLRNHAWLDAVFHRGTLSAATRLIDLVGMGAFGEKVSADDWCLSKILESMIGDHPEIRLRIYGLLKSATAAPGFEFLARAVSENPDEDGLLLLTQLEIRANRSLASFLTIEKVVTAKIPDEDWKGSYRVVGVPAANLRRNLLAMVTDGGETDAAARRLNEIDIIRDDYGKPDSEPRHPDLASGRGWPILTQKHGAKPTSDHGA